MSTPKGKHTLKAEKLSVIAIGSYWVSLILFLPNFVSTCITIDMLRRGYFKRQLKKLAVCVSLELIMWTIFVIFWTIELRPPQDPRQPFGPSDLDHLPSAPKRNPTPSIVLVLFSWLVFTVVGAMRMTMIENFDGARAKDHRRAMSQVDPVAVVDNTDTRITVESSNIVEQPSSLEKVSPQISAPETSRPHVDMIQAFTQAGARNSL